MSRKGGIIQVQVNGVLYDAKGNATYNLGRPKRDAIVGSDGVHGFKETPQPAFLEVAFTDRGNLSLDVLTRLEGATVTLSLANGKTVVFSQAWYAGEGNVTTDEGEIGARFEAITAEEV